MNGFSGFRLNILRKGVDSRYREEQEDSELLSLMPCIERAEKLQFGGRGVHLYGQKRVKTKIEN
jgi:hypothetical protein